MEYTTVTNIHWSDSDQTTIDCTVDFVGLGSVPFTVNQNDTENHSIKLCLFDITNWMDEYHCQQMAVENKGIRRLAHYY